MQPRERFTITIEDAGDRNSVPVAPRLRRLLKAMLRAYSFRCRDIRPAETRQPTTSKNITEGTGNSVVSSIKSQ